VSTSDLESANLSADDAWTILLALAARAKAGNAVTTPMAIGLTDGKVEFDAINNVALIVDPEAARGWTSGSAETEDLSSEFRSMLDIYMPLCVGASANSLVVAHLGQSLDGRIATQSGVSQFITGDENIVHTHRLRALFDAVLVGANTASTDNPKLTTRRADGEHATRVLLDPQCSVDPEASIFTDGVARTMVLCDSAFAPADQADTHIALPTVDRVMAPDDIIAALKMLGLKRIFVEGGGVTVSQFLEAGALHRLHVCVAPMIIGSGRPSFRLPEVDNLTDSVYLDVQHFPSGKDILFDCQLRKKE
jgi:riboflavin-specific deaminase-like protein